jgi:hypothetical protein
MAEIVLTTDPIRLTAATRQERYLAADISAYDRLDVQLYVPVVEGTNPVAIFRLLTGLTIQTDLDAWTEVCRFAPVTVDNTEQLRRIDGPLLNFLRWELVSLSGTSPAVTFVIRGLGRTGGR